MITHEINRSGDSTVAPVVESFHLDPADRAALGRFLMPVDELAAELRASPNLARPKLQAAMLGVLKAASIGTGMNPVDAHDRAFGLLHNGVAREIVLKILE
jgi:hypothetical protein